MDFPSFSSVFPETHRAKMKRKRQEQAQREQQATMRWTGVKAAFQRHAKAMLQQKLPVEEIDRMAEKAIKRYLRGGVPIK